MEATMPVSSGPLANSANISRVRTTNTGEIMVLRHQSTKRWIPKTVVTPDFTHQLDLFSQATIEEESAAAPPARTTEVPHGKPRPPQQISLFALAATPAEGAAAIAAGKPA